MTHVIYVVLPWSGVPCGTQRFARHSFKHAGWLVGCYQCLGCDEHGTAAVHLSLCIQLGAQHQACLPVAVHQLQMLPAAAAARQDS